MAVKLSHPVFGSVVKVPEADVARWEAQGWARVPASGAEPPRILPEPGAGPRVVDGLEVDAGE